MDYSQNYPQQNHPQQGNWPQGNPQQGNWQHGSQPEWLQPDYQEPAASGSPALAVIAAILGLAVGGVLVYLNIDLRAETPTGFDVPEGWTVMSFARFAVAGIALIGAILVFARKVAGAFILLVTALLAIAAVLVNPFVAKDIAITLAGDLRDLTDVAADSATSAYYELLLEFGNTQAVLLFAAGCAAVVLLVIAVLPPSLNYLRGSRRSTW